MKRDASSMPTWIIFDVGGVLLDWPSSSDATAAHIGVTHNELFDVLFNQTVKMSIGAKMNIGEITAEEGWRMVLSELKKEHAPEEIINRWYVREFWLEDTLKLIVELHQAGYKLAIMSNSWLGLTDPKKNESFPEELRLFDMVFDSSIEGVKKPDPAFYEIVERRTGSKGNELLLIDDEPQNLEVAEERGWQTVLYGIHGDKPSELSSLHLRLFSSGRTAL